MNDSHRLPLQGRRHLPPRLPAPRGESGRAPGRGAATPTVSEADLRAERERKRAALALEFADLDDDEDRIWIDLENLVEPDAPMTAPQAFPAEEREPVAYFAETSDPGPVRPASTLEAGPRPSIVEEITKAVPPPES